MASTDLKLHVSYSQFCVFSSTLSQPFNDWSDRNVSQGFAWRPGSVSFRTLIEEGKHQVRLFVDENVPPLSERCVRAFRIPFETCNGKMEIASIADGTELEIPAGKYTLQVEFFDLGKENGNPKIYVRLNMGDTDWCILKSDETIDVSGELDLMAKPAS